MNKFKSLSIFLIVLTLVIIIFIIKYIIPNNKYLSEIKSEVNNFLYKYDSFDDELPVIMNKDENSPCENFSSISKDEATQDVEYLFSLLKFGYSGYEFFGGDSTFIPAKENIIWSVIASDGADICINKFLDIIYSELKFIQDSHFNIGNYKLCNYTKYFSSKKFIFHKDNTGFYTKIYGKPFYLEKVNNESP
ncbi:hypothetical protein [Tissierella sp.]|uniref:hypothetical protein n=1 Tax=Tissierella sp. TaxID=41274 RepID=UPI0028AB2F8E|nr:hypothetical protein [Tissierella sp.]